MSRKTVTLEDILNRMDDGFDKVNLRFETVDKRLDKIDGRLDRMDGRFDQIDGRLDRMDGRFEAVEGRLDGLEGRVIQLRDTTNGLGPRLDRTDRRLDGLEGQLNTLARVVAKGFAEAAEDRQKIRDEFSSKIDSYSRVVDANIKQTETYMHEMLAISSKVDRLDARLTHLELAKK